MVIATLKITRHNLSPILYLVLFQRIMENCLDSMNPSRGTEVENGGQRWKYM